MVKSLLLMALLVNTKLISQPVVEGAYAFRRHEMVAGFNFSAGNRFEFFYSYGAVDRMATGSFTVEGDTLKLKSDKPAGKDFRVTSQSREGTGYTVRFDHPNKYLLSHIRCIFFSEGKKTEELTDQSGQVHVSLAHCDTIYVQHLLYPDVLTLVKDQANNNTRFNLQLNPSLEQVSFKGINFKIENDSVISCLPNYFMDIEGIEFEKE
jgi:hypothetical protein